jgi:plasmid maintenance system antidote protein VapI
MSEQEFRELLEKLGLQREQVEQIIQAARKINPDLWRGNIAQKAGTDPLVYLVRKAQNPETLTDGEKAAVWAITKAGLSDGLVGGDE